MYQTFDKFLATDTWGKDHPSDEKRFFQALDRVVRDSDFDPDKMGEYMRQKKRPKGQKRPLTKTEAHPFGDAIKDYVAAAWAVKDYLAATGA
jgi:hypothetical protein